MTPASINLQDKLAGFSEKWSPKIIAEANGFHVKLAKLEGDFVWHSHSETDELFLVIQGQLRIDFRDGAATLNSGEMLVVPKGMEHKPYAESECHVMILVREGTLNTGDSPESDRTADPTARI